MAKPGLYAQAVERALRAHKKLPLRSEAQKDYEDLFVDANQLESLDTPDWQVIFGRRGTGKTFLLKLLDEKGLDRVVRERQLYVYISAQDAKVEPVGHDVDDRLRAVGFFQTFIELLVGRLTQSVESLLGKPGFLEPLNQARRRALDRADSLLLELLELSQTGAPVKAFQWVEQIQSETNTQENHSAVSGSAHISVKPSGASGGLGAGVKGGRQSQSTREASTESRGVPVPRYALVREKLLELTDVLNIARLNILIDEWAVLDPSAATAIQPEFADLLKRTFAGSPRISIKVATNRYQTRFSNKGAGPNYRGLEMDADIFQAVNLDRALVGENELARFYEQLLFKRLVYCDCALQEFDPHRTGYPDEQFVSAIFRDRLAFIELVKGAEGVPRDFIAAFNSLAQMNGYSVVTAWRRAQVRDVVLDRSVEGQREIEYQSEASQLLNPCIKQVVVDTASRLFLVKRDDSAEIATALDELLEKRMVHEYPGRELPGELRGTFAGYLLDYGLWLDWERAIQDDDSVEDPLVPRIHAPTDAEPHVIDVSQIDRANQIRCKSCNAVFQRHSRPYRMRRLCPECFAPADQEPLIDTAAA